LGQKTHRFILQSGDKLFVDCGLGGNNVQVVVAYGRLGKMSLAMPGFNQKVKLGGMVFLVISVCFFMWGVANNLN